MIKVGFIVEGPSDSLIIKEPSFREWLRNDCKIEVIDPVISADGNGQMCSTRIGDMAENLRGKYKPDKVVVLADLDPEQCAPCITRRRAIIDHKDINLVVIARKAMESWFLADTKAMQRWTGNSEFSEPEPEMMSSQKMPWDRLKELSDANGRGPGASKKVFAKRFIKHGFDIREAARHKNCPSARYFIGKLCQLGQS